MRIGIIGHFGGNKVFNDGQTIKTVAIYEALRRYGVKRIDKIDTYYIKKNPIRFFLSFAKGVSRDKKFIVLLSSNGRRALFPVLYMLSELLHKEIYHYGIGGRLAREVSERPRWRKFISAFKGNWMESSELAERLQALNVRNAIYLPNFKNLTILTENDLPKDYSEPYLLCIFSRVMKEKGVEDAIAAVGRINEKYGRTIVKLDIYGPIEYGYEERLQEVLGTSDACQYCGVVPADKSVEVLKRYYVLLFPTHWKHEGIPGTIIDGLSAGLPIVCRRWQYCDEMLQHKLNAYIYDFEEPGKLEDTIVFAIEHKQETIAMKKNCLKKAEQYSEPYVIKYVAEQMRI